MLLNSVSRDALLKPLSAVSGIVERRQTLPVLSNVLVEHSGGVLSFTATDLEIQITAKTALEGGAAQGTTVAARKFQDLLRALPEDSVLRLEATDAKLNIKAGRSRYHLQTLPAASFPRIETSADRRQSLSFPQKVLRRLLHLVEFAMAQQDVRYYLNGLLLVIEGQTLVAVATDGHRLSYASTGLDSSFERQEVIIPRKTVQELSKLLEDTDAPVSLEILANQVRLQFSEVEVVSKVIDGKFPDYNRVIPVGYARHVLLNRVTLLQTLQRAAILANEKYRGVRLVLAPGSLRIICTNAEQEEAEEELEIDYQGAELDVGFNISYLQDVLTHLDVPEITLSFGDSGSSALITIPERGDYKYVVMPMRI